MRATEILNELVVSTKTLDHLQARALKVAELCDPIADRTLLFREFNIGIPKTQGTLAVKVLNQDENGPRGPLRVKQGLASDAQAAILSKVGIQNPVFVVMSRPVSVRGIHGDSHIFIPPAGANVWWSPEIEDLGGQALAGGKALGQTVLKHNVTKTTRGVMAADADKWAATYRKEWPTTPTKNELIFDCEYYYLVNLELFASKFLGDEGKKMIQRTQYATIVRAEIYNATFRNYGDVARYMRTSVPAYLDWFRKEYPHAK